MPYKWDFKGFEAGVGDGENYDALADLQQSVRQNIVQEHRDWYDEMCGPNDHWIINVSDTFEHLDGDADGSWGHVNYEIVKVIPRYAGKAFVDRKELWKQLPLLANSNPKDLHDWDIKPSPVHLKGSYKQPPKIEWLEKSVNGIGSLHDLSDERWTKTFALIGQAIKQPHFLFFSRALISGEGGHTSSSDPAPHATVRLRNDKLNEDKMEVIAHIYNDEEYKYVGHRIFVASPVPAIPMAGD
ncbi:hypothetical protein FDECE_4496 [Fusarium decemcellulare]|nr:hypothetical protein FDECE_4496 [Fusarium decemcellulare]